MGKLENLSQILKRKLSIQEQFIINPRKLGHFEPLACIIQKKNNTKT
jgi:hypothetical protein